MCLKNPFAACLKANSPKTNFHFAFGICFRERNESVSHIVAKDSCPACHLTSYDPVFISVLRYFKTNQLTVSIGELLTFSKGESANVQSLSNYACFQR